MQTVKFATSVLFLSTLSLRRATNANLRRHSGDNDFYPRSPCGERHNINSSVNTADQISIHALLAESDTSSVNVSASGSTFLSTLSLRRATHIFDDISGETRHFYPRSPCGERPNLDADHAQDILFLSTLSLRRATASRLRRLAPKLDFYPRSPCGERPRALRNSQAKQQFLSTLSLRRATSAL